MNQLIAGQQRWYRNVSSLSSSSPTSSSSSSSSVSPTEVSKFSNMYKKWWHPKYNPLISMNPVRVQYILDILSTQKQMQKQKQQKKSTTSTQKDDKRDYSSKLKGYRALDVGCGGGLLSESLARLGASVTAIDPSKELVEMAKIHSRLDPITEANIHYRSGISVEQLLQEKEDQGIEDQFQYDIICCLEVIEHVPDIHSLLLASSKLLKKDGGILYVSTLNRTWKSYALAIVGAECIMRYLPLRTHDWNQFLSPQELQQRYMDHLHLKPINVSGMVPEISSVAPNLRNLQNWQWNIDATDTDVNWIGAYQYQFPEKPERQDDK